METTKLHQRTKQRVQTRRRSVFAGFVAAAAFAVALVAPSTSALAASAGDWLGYANGGTGQSVTTTATVPTSSASTTLSWAKKPFSEQWGTVGDSLVIGDYLYTVAGPTWPSQAAVVYKYNRTNGDLVAQKELRGNMGYFARPAYVDGVIVVALDKGVVDAVEADSLNYAWTNPVAQTADYAQSLSTPTVSGDDVYIATADTVTNSVATSGTIRRINAKTGAVEATVTNANSGYYWAGGVVANGFFVIGDDAGNLESYDAQTLVSAQDSDSGAITNGAAIRSSITSSQGEYHVAGQDGVLYTFQVESDGTVSSQGGVAFSAASTGAAVSDSEGTIFAVGQTGPDFTSTGELDVIDNGAVSQKVTSFQSVDGTVENFPGKIQSAPLVVENASGTYVYFTSNNNPGSLYVYKKGDATATEVYRPDSDKQQYCTASPLLGPDGTVYYTNDSGYLFAVKAN